MRLLALPLLLVCYTVFSTALWAAPQEPIRITASNLTLQHATGTATFTGQVRVVQGSLVLTANTVTALYKAALTSLIASGNVVFARSATEQASGDRAAYTPQTNTLILTGNTVTLRRGPSTLVGDKLVYNLATQQAVVTKQGGPVQATFIPQ